MPSNIPSPILIFGDLYVSKNNVIAVKRKFPNLTWVTKSATTDSVDDIRAEAGLSLWTCEEKVIIIQDIPNQKAIREFLVDLAKNCPITTKLLIWDSNEHIGVDPKTKAIDKTWSEFVNEFGNIKGSKIVNNGAILTEKEGGDSIDYVIKRFESRNRKIGYKEAKLLTTIVGFDRGMLDSDIKKMCLTCPEVVDAKFIIENAFPTTSDAVLYKLGNVIDDGTLEDCINMTERFLASGTNENEIAVILIRKARWQLVVASLWSLGLDWGSISNKMMDMGKFPSSLWHNDQLEDSRKRKEAELVQSPTEMMLFMNKQQGVPERYFKPIEDKATPKGKTAMSRKNAEIVPMSFMADLTVNFVRNKIARTDKYPIDEIKKRVLDRAIKVYRFCSNKMAEIRYGGNPTQDLQEMIKALNNTSLENF